MDKKKHADNTDNTTNTANTANTAYIAFILIAIAILLVFAPLILLKGTQFVGSDDLGSAMVDEISGGGYEPWFKPVTETIIGGELPGEVETLLFSIQTGIGVGVLAYCFGYLVARKKYGGDGRDNGNNSDSSDSSDRSGGKGGINGELDD